MIVSIVFWCIAAAAAPDRVSTCRADVERPHAHEGACLDHVSRRQAAITAGLHDRGQAFWQQPVFQCRDQAELLKLRAGNPPGERDAPDLRPLPARR